MAKTSTKTESTTKEKQVSIHKFSWVELFNNNSGKSSSTKFVGLITSFVCIFIFTTLVLFYFFNQTESSTVLLLIDKTTLFFSIAAGLMGVKSLSTAIGGNKITTGTSKKRIQVDEDDE